MEIKTSNGMKVLIKKLSVDEKDELLDPLEWNVDENGQTTGCKKQFSTATKFVRVCVDKYCKPKSKEFKDFTEEVLSSLSSGDKLEIFTELFVRFTQGEGKAS